MSSTTTTADQSPAAPLGAAGKSSNGLLFWAGVVVAIGLIPLFFAQVFWANVLVTPWYVPIGGTLAALAVLVATAGSRRWWKVGATLLCVALAGLEWAFVGVLTVLPGYTGPIEVGSPLPQFHATLGDGTQIDESYFQQNRPKAIVFFQGRWCPFCMTQLRELEAHQEDFNRVGAEVVVVSLEDVEAAAATQRDFPHLTAISDERRELSNAVDLINKNFAPDGSDADAPTILLVDGSGTVQWLHRPTRFIARPNAAELVTQIEKQQAR